MNTEKEIFKSFEELEFRDDFMFGLTMSDPGLCHDVLECLLQMPIGRLLELNPQKEFRETSDGKPIRLDIYTRDDLSVYDAEMQNRNKHSVEFLALPKRTRYYQALIDSNNLKGNDSYRSLPNSYILFICTFDPFGEDKGCYTFVEQCLEIPGLKLEDGTEKRFYNCTYDGDDIPDSVKRFFKYNQSGEATDDLTSRIDEAVAEARKKEEWGVIYVKERLYISDIIEEYKWEAETYKQEAVSYKHEAEVKRHEAEVNRKLAEEYKEKLIAAGLF